MRLADRPPVRMGLLSSAAGWLLKQAVGLHGSESTPEAGITHRAQGAAQHDAGQNSTAEHRTEQQEHVVSHAYS